MINLNCFVGRLRENLGVDFPLTLADRSIADFFRNGSVGADGRPGINLSLNTSRYDNSIIPHDRNTSAFTLHWALNRLTGNGAYQYPIDSIGLVLADRYPPRSSVLGIMFDLGFDPEGEPSVGALYNSVPREGCAIFLDAISRIRRSDSDFRSEVVFTAIHELGHVFNLWHENSPDNFMAQSVEEGPFELPAYFFLRRHQSFLSGASTSKYVQPGGARYGSRGSNGPRELNPYNNVASSSPIAIKISIAQDTFWSYEPVELDISVRLKRHSGKLEIPDKIDPGYEEFKILVTQPDGTIFRYRSPRIYCRNTATIALEQGASFDRDISIFGQSGGYTFSQPGHYRIQVFFEYKRTKWVKSNILDVTVKEPGRRTSEQNLKKLLTTKDVSLLLYHRDGLFSSKRIQAIFDEVKRLRNTETKMNIYYALSRYLARQPRLQPKQLEMLTRLANTAIDFEQLSKNRHLNLVRVIKECNVWHR